jgi:hypothetical protein
MKKFSLRIEYLINFESTIEELKLQISDAIIYFQRNHPDIMPKLRNRCDSTYSISTSLLSPLFLSSRNISPPTFNFDDQIKPLQKRSSSNEKNLNFIPRKGRNLNRILAKYSDDSLSRNNENPSDTMHSFFANLNRNFFSLKNFWSNLISKSCGPVEESNQDNKCWNGSHFTLNQPNSKVSEDELNDKDVTRNHNFNRQLANLKSFNYKLEKHLKLYQSNFNTADSFKKETKKVHRDRFKEININEDYNIDKNSKRKIELNHLSFDSIKKMKNINKTSNILFDSFDTKKPPIIDYKPKNLFDLSSKKVSSRSTTSTSSSSSHIIPFNTHSNHNYHSNNNKTDDYSYYYSDDYYNDDYYQENTGISDYDLQRFYDISTKTNHNEEGNNQGTDTKYLDSVQTPIGKERLNDDDYYADDYYDDFEPSHSATTKDKMRNTSQSTKETDDILKSASHVTYDTTNSFFKSSTKNKMDENHHKLKNNNNNSPSDIAKNKVQNNQSSHLFLKINSSFYFTFIMFSLFTVAFDLNWISFLL